VFFLHVQKLRATAKVNRLIYLYLYPKFYSCNLFKAAQKRRLGYMYFGTLQSSIKFVCDGPIKDAHHKKKEIEL
jgi:hypothetical protein